jgi:hypothetical protein
MKYTVVTDENHSVIFVVPYSGMGFSDESFNVYCPANCEIAPKLGDKYKE